MPDWSIVNPPPEGHPDVASWAWNLFEISRRERRRLNLEERWRTSYRLYRGDHGQGGRNRAFTMLNLFFANIERTKANITARKPVAQVRNVDGVDDGSDKILSAKAAAWWQDTNQQSKLKSSCLSNEINGATVEKAVWEKGLGRPNVLICDPFSFFPAPGKWEDISIDPPFVCHAVAEVVEIVEKTFGVEPGTVNADDVYTILGEDRELFRPKVVISQAPGTTNVDSGITYHGTSAAGLGSNWNERRALVVEVWVHDYTTETIISQEVTGIDEQGKPIITKASQERQIYPDGIRVITVTNNGDLLLDDKPNPNLNHAILDENCMSWGRYPFYLANSYEDTTSIWGFSAVEQTSDLNAKINELFSKMFAYIMRAMLPPLILPKDCGVETYEVNNKPGLILRPHSAQHAAGIRFVPVPPLSADFFTIFNMMIELYDRVYQIEDADRGERPTGVIAASAIVALQERNAVLIQHKINAMDHLVEMRGRWAISFWQNFGLETELVEIKGSEPAEFRGINFAGRRFKYVVESGSTVPKTSLQLEEQAKEFYKAGAIDRQALLEAVNFPGWKEIIERVGEGQLGQAIQVLIQAGLPEDIGQQLYQQLMQPQGGPGNRPQGQQPTAGNPAVQTIQPGVPRAYQGAVR